MTRDRIMKLLKKHIFPEPSANVYCDVGGLEEAADAIAALTNGKTLTEFDRAELRLKAWQAVDGWGVTSKNPGKEGEEEVETFKRWNWPDRMQKAHELFQWMIEQKA